MCAVTGAHTVHERKVLAQRRVLAGSTVQRIEWIVALVVVVTIGLDPSYAIWHAASTSVPLEFRTVSISASDFALLILAAYGWRIVRQGSFALTRTMRLIAWTSAILAISVILSSFTADTRWLSFMRVGDVILGGLACLTVACRRSLAMRMLVCGAGLIVLQLPQVIIQEVTQTSVSFGSRIPGWPPVTSATVPGALVAFGSHGERWQRAMGSFLHPNLLGGFLALALVFALPWLTRGVRSAACLWPIWTIAWIELVLTFSRSALIAAIAGCLVWGIAQVGYAHHWRRIAAVTIVPLAVCTVLAIALGNVVLPRLDLSHVLQSDSVTERLRLAEIGAHIIASHPLWGVGAGNYSLVESRLPLSAMSVQPVHIVPVLIAAEAGIIAGIAWLVLVVGGPIVELRANWPDARRCCERFAIPAVILMLALQDHYFWTFAPGQALFWIGLGVWASHLDPRGYANDQNAPLPARLTGLSAVR